MSYYIVTFVEDGKTKVMGVQSNGDPKVKGMVEAKRVSGSMFKQWVSAASKIMDYERHREP